MLWYSIEAPQRGTSNEYPQHMFLLRNKKNIDTFWLKKKNALSRAIDKELKCPNIWGKYDK